MQQVSRGEVYWELGDRDPWEREKEWGQGEWVFYQARDACMKGCTCIRGCSSVNQRLSAEISGLARWECSSKGERASTTSAAAAVPRLCTGGSELGWADKGLGGGLANQ